MDSMDKYQILVLDFCWIVWFLVRQAVTVVFVSNKIAPLLGE